VVVDGDGELPADQLGEQFGEAEQFVEASFQCGRLLGQVGAEAVPEGLILGIGVESVDGVGERSGAGGGPDEDAPEHQGGAGDGVFESEDLLAMLSGNGEGLSWDYRTRGRGVHSHATQAPSLEVA
jgi:hypothetical protein